MTNFSKIWEMMKKYIFEIDPQIFIHMKCAICNKLLNDAWDGPCGCNYCKSCVTKYLENGCEYCPGDSKECKLVKLSIGSNIVKSNSTDRKISKLQVKCPLESCQYASDMGDMSDHIAICDKLRSSCPFSEMGCLVKSVTKHALESHLSTEILLHNQLLISGLGNMKHEIISAVFDQISSHGDLERLIDKKLADKFDHWIRENNLKQAAIDGLSQELRDLTKRHNELTEALKEANDRQAKEIDQLRALQIERDIPRARKRKRITESSTATMGKSRNCSLAPLMPPQLQFRSQLGSSTHKWTPIATHTWDVTGKSLRNGAIGPPISSTHFDSFDRQYQMALDLIPCDLSDSDIGNKNIVFVRFYIKSALVADEQRPSQMEVTIAVKNKANPLACRSESRQCDVVAGSPLLKYFWIVQSFPFKYADLVRDRVAVARTDVSIECSVGVDYQV